MTFALIVLVFIAGQSVGGGTGAASVGPFMAPTPASFTGANAEALCNAAITALQATPVYHRHPNDISLLCVQTAG